MTHENNEYYTIDEYLEDRFITIINDEGEEIHAYKVKEVVGKAIAYVDEFNN